MYQCTLQGHDRNKSCNVDDEGKRGIKSLNGGIMEIQWGEQDMPIITNKYPRRNIGQQCKLICLP